MYRSERWPEESDGRARSRRGSASRRGAREPAPSAPASVSATPRKHAKPSNLDFLVTGKQIVKRSDRANSLPGACRRPSLEGARTRRAGDSPRRAPHAPATRENTLQDDMSLDLSQVSDFEDTLSKYGSGRAGPVTSTPLPGRGKQRSASLQSAPREPRRGPAPLSGSRDSFRTSTSSGSPYRAGTELDYSSVSPEYSGQSSGELTPTRASQCAASPPATPATPASRALQLSSCCVSSWAECSDSGAAGVPAGGVRGARGGCSGEWCSFWASYNSSVSGVGRYYDQCPTPYRTDTLDLADFEFTDGTRKRSPDNVEVINNIIRHQGLTLTARETQSIIKCAHLLGNVLATAIDRRSEPRVDQSAQPEQPARSNMTLDLKETTIPLEVKEEKTCETTTTQTDISLPNTRSAPRIFENILRQLSRSSIDVDKIESKDKTQVKPDVKGDAAEAKEPRGEVTEAKGDAGEAQSEGDAQGNVTSEAKGDNSSQVSDVKKEE
ncbi:uncharacterized protein LOC124644559 [Helicoverpa zea]|uniref:uncharacterized protein LOC124644559 n=1 Tax=Helicoverpa zea TaxID=7113 RepID=UPI001F58A152|nr:uncharacterized protein LOC124644559 [Helicoverpa zea]